MICAQRRSNGLGKDPIEMGSDVDLGHAGLDCSNQFLIGNAGGAVQYQRHGHGSVKRTDQLKIESGATLSHCMRRADRDAERIHARCLDECPGLVGIGPRAGCMDTLLAADLAKFGLDIETAIVALPHYAVIDASWHELRPTRDHYLQTPLTRSRHAHTLGGHGKGGGPRDE